MKYENEFEHRVAFALPRLFASRGVKATVHPSEWAQRTGNKLPDMTCDLEIDNRKIRIDVEVKSRWSQAVIDQLKDLARESEETPWMLVLPKIRRALHERLRERGINHADLVGRLYLHVPGIRIDVDGVTGRPLIDQDQTGRERQINPFSKKASLVLRALFEAPREPIRFADLTARTGLASGWVSEVSEALVARGYATSSAHGVRLLDPVSALRDWSAAYDWRRNSRRTFVVPFGYDELADRLSRSFRSQPMDWALTLIAAVQRRVGYVRYEGTIHVYARTADVETLDRALQELYAEESGGDGTLAILEPYYGRAAFYGAEELDGIPVVSDVQLFLDVAHFPVRGAEAAEMLVRKRLAPKLQLQGHEVQGLLSDLV